MELWWLRLFGVAICLLLYAMFLRQVAATHLAPTVAPSGKQRMICLEKTLPLQPRDQEAVWRASEKHKKHEKSG